MSVKGVIETNDDAAGCKASCVKLGYYHDEFVQYFVRENVRRPPLINRGYYSRVSAFRKIIKSFLNTVPSSSKQIVSLGAGFDTTFWMLKTDTTLQSVAFTMFELDLPEVVQRKVAIIDKTPELRNVVAARDASPAQTKDSIHSNHYHLMAVDLNNLETLEQTLFKNGVDVKLPTLFISECVLIYLKPEKGDAIIKWVSDTFSAASFCTYEQIGPNDAFGSVMIQNLERGCPLQSIQKYPDITSQRKRYSNMGWESVDVWSMLDVYANWLDKPDVTRIQKIEMFDEFEEWRLIQSHYCIVWANQDNSQQDSVQKFWKDLGFK